MLDERPIIIDDRYADMIRGHSIRDIYDALVEIITNCDDSYHNLFAEGKRVKDGGDILIEIQRRRGDQPSLVFVRDRAEGMTLQDMQEKLGRMGARTSGEGARGSMGRGLKDCTALGNIRVDSIVNGRHYACELFRRHHGTRIRDLENGAKVDQALREKIGVGKKNGTVVTLQYVSSKRLPLIENIQRDLPLHYALRDIVASDDSRIIVRKEGEAKRERKQERLIFSPIPGDVVLNEEGILVPGYPEATFSIVIRKSPEMLKDKEPRMRQSGILIKDVRAIHQCTLFKCETEDDLAKHYHGRLECAYISSLLKDFDERRKRDMELVSTNPFALVDPNRQGGLSEEHPFTKALFGEARKRLKALIDADRRQLNEKTGDVSNKETRKLLDELARFADQFRKEQIGSEDLTPGESNAFDSVVQNGIAVYPPRFNIGVGEVKTLTVYIAKSRYNAALPMKTRPMDGGRVIAIKQGLAKKTAKPHPRREDVVYHSFKVLGVDLGASRVVVSHGDLTPVDVVGNVVKKREEGDMDLEAPLVFEKNQYSLTEGATKRIKLFAESSLVKSRATVRVWSSDTKNVPIMGGESVVLHRHARLNYAVGEVEIKGRGNTELRRADISAKLGEHTATTKVSVRVKTVVGGGFRFELVPRQLGVAIFRMRWAVDSDGNMTNLLEISAVHPSIQPYMGPPPNFPKQGDAESRALLAELITDAVCSRTLNEKMRKDPRDFDLSGLSPHDAWSKIRHHYDEEVNEFAEKAHKILLRR